GWAQPPSSPGRRPFGGGQLLPHLPKAAPHRQLERVHQLLLTAVERLLPPLHPPHRLGHPLCPLLVGHQPLERLLGNPQRLGPQAAPLLHHGPHSSTNRVSSRDSTRAAMSL